MAKSVKKSARKTVKKTPKSTLAEKVKEDLEVLQIEKEVAPEKAATIEAEVVKKVKGGKLVLSINEPTPMWCTYIFRAVLLTTTAVAAWLAATGLMSPQSKVEILLGLKGLDFIVWGLARLVGVKKEDIIPEVTT